jgi:integrase
VQQYVAKTHVFGFQNIGVFSQFRASVQQNSYIDAVAMKTENERKYLTEEELKRFFAVIESPRDRAIFAVCYWRGLRASELGKLQMSSYRPEAKRLYVERVKGSMDGEFPLSPFECRTLNAWLKIRGAEPGPLFRSRQGRGINRTVVFRMMRYYASLAGLPLKLAHPHVLKHSLGTHLIARHLEVMDVKDWLGHRAVASTMKYLEYRSKQRDEAAQKIHSSS